MALPALGYLGYLGLTALAGLLASSCNSKEEQAPSPPPEFMLSPEPPPPPPPPTLMVKEDSPAYKIFLQLKQAGLKPTQMDGVNESDEKTSYQSDSAKPEIPPTPLEVQLKSHTINSSPKSPGDGKITELDLYYTGTNFFRRDLSLEENKKWRAKFQMTFQETSDRFFQMAQTQSGPTPPLACQGVDLFRKAAFWNPQNAKAQWIVGACKSEPKRLFQAIRINPEFKEAKHALEGYYLEKNKNHPEDVLTWMNLGYALKIQGKMDEALKCFHKAHELNEKSVTAVLELREIYLWQGKDTAAGIYRDLLNSRPRNQAPAEIRSQREGVAIEGPIPGEEKIRLALWKGPYNEESLKWDELSWGSGPSEP